MLKRLSALKDDAGFIRYFKNTSWMMAEHVLRIFSGLFVGVWIARHLGPEKFGLLSYVMAFTAIFGGIAKLGMDGIVVREIVNRPDKSNEILNGAFWLKLVGAVLAIAIMSLALCFTSNDENTTILIYIVAFGLVLQSFEVVEFYFQSQVLSKTVSICKALQLALSSLIKIALVLSGADIMSFAVVATLDALLLAIWYVVSYKLHKKDAFFGRVNIPAATELLKYSWPMVFHTVMVMIYMKIDQVMIKEMLGDHEVGQYSVGIRLVESIFFLPTVIVTSLFPAILNAKKVSQELYEKRLVRLFSFLLLLSVAGLIFLQATSQHLVPLLFGKSYIGAITVLDIYSLALPFIFMTVASSRWFISENMQKQFFLRSAIAVLINISLNCILIPLYGVNGAALATLATYFYLAVMHDALDKKSISLLKCKLRSVMFWRYL